MAEQETEKPQIVTTKSLMTAGPTLHYSHSNVITFWFFSIVVFGITCLFWSKICSGSFWSYDYTTLFSPQSWGLGRVVNEGVSIFEYPWQILVLGLLMGIIAVVPVLVSQLMSFRYSLPFVAEIFFIANMPIFAFVVLISCVAVALRPLRFRSRIASIALCITPQLFYWAFLGRVRGSEPLVWGFSYTPWICAWIISLCIAGAVVGIGHFTRYRPGLVFASTSLVLMITIIVFNVKVGFDELDYQLYVAKYVAKDNPELVEQFRSHSITEALDKTLADKQIVQKLIRAYFYSEEPIVLRGELKSEIIERLSSGSWPWWFNVPDELKFSEKREQLFADFDRFIKTRIQSKRMPIALYLKAIITEYRPDIMEVELREMLSFDSDYPSEAAFPIWLRLYEEYPKSPESLEARWRIAKIWAGQKRIAEARSIVSEAQKLLKEQLSKSDIEQKQTDSIFNIFHSPTDTAMTAFRLNELQVRLFKLQELISQANLNDGQGSYERLSEFVKLNPHIRDYASGLEDLIKRTGEKDGLYDNMLLEQTMLIPDDQLRMEKLAALNAKYSKTDGGIEALYELGMLKKRLLQEQQSGSEQKKKLLLETKDIFTSFLKLYPDSFYSESVKKILAGLPKAE